MGPSMCHSHHPKQQIQVLESEEQRFKIHFQGHICFVSVNLGMFLLKQHFPVWWWFFQMMNALNQGGDLPEDTQ